jgi:signal transduction histidine kinase
MTAAVTPATATRTEVRLLVERLARRCADLEFRAAELERANRELAAVAADAAHDLRAPVQVISGFAEVLIRREGARLDETSQQCLTHILNAASGMRELVEAVLDHRQASSAELTVAPVDSLDLVLTVLDRLRAQLEEADAEVEVHELPVVRADRVQLARVFQNLVSNALEATPPGKRPKVVLSSSRLPTGWELSVTDNGVGVPTEDRARIFELFQRGQAGKRSGKGMGLAICKAVVERHGGCIDVERAPGGGSRFAFSLPDQTPA